MTADQFVEWVFLADSQNPNTSHKGWLNHKNKLKATFIQHMGADVAEASKLKYSNNERSSSPNTALNKCIVEFRLHNPEICIRNLVARQRAVFYPVIQIADNDCDMFSNIEVCWFEHDPYWLEEDEEEMDFIQILFRHGLESKICDTVYNLAKLGNLKTANVER